MQARMVELWSTYSAHDLRMIADFLTRSTDLAIECTKENQQGGANREDLSGVTVSFLSRVPKTNDSRQTFR